MEIKVLMKPMEVFGTYPAQTTEPPQDICDKITAKRPGWTWGDFA